MILIELFHQPERVGKVSYLEVAPEVTFGALRERLEREFGLGPDALLSLKDEEYQPIDEAARIKDCATPQGLKVHIHRHQAGIGSRRDSRPHGRR
jgi:hypothetical protein